MRELTLQSVARRLAKDDSPAALLGLIWRLRADGAWRETVHDVDGGSVYFRFVHLRTGDAVEFDAEDCGDDRLRTHISLQAAPGRVFMVPPSFDPSRKAV